MKRVTATELFLAEKMPADFSALSKEELTQILKRKYAKLSAEDKVGTGWASGGWFVIVVFSRVYTKIAKSTTLVWLILQISQERLALQRG